MWAVYTCGCTDCFFAALFVSEDLAHEWAKTHAKNPEGYYVKYWDKVSDIDMTDTGWEQPK